MKYKCLIVDDEKLGRDLLKSYLAHFQQFELIGECASALDALPFLAQNQVDVLFLDIHMPQISGLELLRQQQPLPLTILCTAYSEYALESYELDVVDYLLKPIALMRFSKAISKLMTRLNAKNALVTVTKKMEEKSYPTYFFVKSEYKKIKIVIDEIDYIEAMEKYIQIHCGKQKTLTLMSMSQVMQHLPKDLFLRIHRSFIIHKNKIEQIEGNMISIAGRQLPVSRANRKILDGLLLS